MPGRVPLLMVEQVLNVSADGEVSWKPAADRLSSGCEVFDCSRELCPPISGHVGKQWKVFAFTLRIISLLPDDGNHIMSPLEAGDPQDSQPAAQIWQCTEQLSITTWSLSYP